MEGVEELSIDGDDYFGLLDRPPLSSIPAPQNASGVHRGTWNTQPRQGAGRLPPRPLATAPGATAKDCLPHSGAAPLLRPGQDTAAARGT